MISLGQNLNAAQIEALNDACPLWRTGDYTVRFGWRGIILKGRQMGITTVFLAVWLINVCSRADINAVFIADDDTNSTVAFERVRLMWENLPDEKRPPKRYSNRAELMFSDNRSTFRILTAGSGTPGRSRTVHLLHGSETAFWNNAGTTSSGLFQSVPQPDLGGTILLESTANGTGDLNEETGEYSGGKGAFFAVSYRHAKEERSGFQAVFLPWFLMEEYQAEPVPGTRWTRDEDGREGAPPELARLFRRYGNEEDLAKKFKLTDRQLTWRRKKIDEPGMGLAKFRREYPCDDVEAFATSGQRFFSMWDELTHTRSYTSIEDLEEMYGPVDHYRGGLDWGKSAPFAFHLAAVFGKGKKRRFEVLEECYAPGKTEDEMADMMIAAMERRNLKPAKVPVFGDPSIFPPKAESARVGEYISDKLEAKGLRMYRAPNGHKTTNSAAKDVLTENRYVVQKTCPNLIRTIPLLVVSATDPETFADGEDHAPDAGLRYLVNGEEPPKSAVVAAIPTVGGTNRSGSPKQGARRSSIFVGGRR